MLLNRSLVTGLAIAASLQVTSSSFAAYSITQSAGAAPTYTNLITFDEPGTPTGAVANNWWSANLGLGVTITDALNPNAVAISDPAEAWVGTGNVAGGLFGISAIAFTGGATSASFQAWDSSGAPSFFGNGLTIVLRDNANNNLAFQQFTGAWGGIGNSWINITTTGGSTFDKIAVFNGTSFHPTYIDNLSWNAVPAPGALGLIGLAGVCSRSRRRRN
jgi:hypothetical protein